MTKKLLIICLSLASLKLCAQQPHETTADLEVEDLFADQPGGAMTEVAKEKALVADFDSRRVIIPFTDRQEFQTSTTRFTFSKVDNTSADDQALRIDYSIQRYGGIAIKIPTMDVTEYAALSFEARLLEGQLPSFHLQFQDIAGNRTKIDIVSFLGDLSSTWTRFEIPLGQLLMMHSPWMKQVNEVALIFLEGQGIIEFDEIWLEKIDGKGMEVVKDIPVFEKSKIPLVVGHAAWSYGGAAFSYDAVKKHNARAPVESKIRYVFPHAGSIQFGPGDYYHFSWNTENAFDLAKLLQHGCLEEEVTIMPMIDGLSHGANELSFETWDKLAEEIGTVIENTPEFGGIHLDMEPHVPLFYYLYTKLRKYTAKPITVAVGSSTKEIFEYTDLVVYMAYDWANTPEGFAEDAQQRLPPFLAAAEEAGTHVMIGVPAIATHIEMEGYSAQQNSIRTETGYYMHEFVQASMEIINRQRSQQDNPICLGASVWALHEQYGLHGPLDTKWYFPTIISEETWNLIRTPSN